MADWLLYRDGQQVNMIKSRLVANSRSARSCEDDKERAATQGSQLGFSSHNNVCCIVQYQISISSSGVRQRSVNIPKILVLSIGEILKGMHQGLVLACSRVLFLIASSQMPSEEDDDEDKEYIASHMRREGDEVSWSVTWKEHLRS